MPTTVAVLTVYKFLVATPAMFEILSRFSMDGTCLDSVRSGFSMFSGLSFVLNTDSDP